MRGSKLNISFGLVNVQVKYASLASSGTGRASATTCCKTHQAPVKMVGRCTVGGEIVEGDEKVMLYQVGEAFVEVDKTGLAADKTGTLKLEAAVPAGSIDPLYFEKAYVVWAQDGAGNEAALDLLAAVLRESGDMLVGTTVIRDATKVMALRWSERTQTIVAHALAYEARLEFAAVAGIAADAAARTQPSEGALELAREIIANLEDSFDTSAVADEYADALDAAIAAAAAGEPAPARAAAAASSPTDDLMAALQASVAAVAA